MAGGEGGSAAQRAGRAGEGGTAVLAKLRPTRPCGADGGGGARKGGKFSKFCFFRFLQKSMRRVLPTRPHRMCAHPGAGAPLPVESAGRERGVVRRSSPRVDSTPKLSSFSKTPLNCVRLKGSAAHPTTAIHTPPAPPGHTQHYYTIPTAQHAVCMGGKGGGVVERRGRVAHPDPEREGNKPRTGH